jgi:hypothetical protein
MLVLPARGRLSLHQNDDKPVRAQGGLKRQGREWRPPSAATRARLFCVTGDLDVFQVGARIAHHDVGLDAVAGLDAFHAFTFPNIV